MTRASRLLFQCWRFPGGVGVATMLLAGCTTVAPAPEPKLTGDPVVDARAALEASAPRERVLRQMELAAAALRAGRRDEARQNLDGVLASLGGIRAGDADARRARSLFGQESDKVFLGEPYERVMAYLYRALLYWEQGEYDNARACCLSAQLADTDPEGRQWEADFVLLEALSGLATAKLGGDGAGTLQHARSLPGGDSLAELDPQATALVFAEFGQGPVKYASGEYGERLSFAESGSQATGARLEIAGQTVTLVAVDDLQRQATTRGPRVMDHILGNKAVFKDATDKAGDVALVAGAAVAAGGEGYCHGRESSEGRENLALGLLVAGILGKALSAATNPEADIRAWSGLPRWLAAATLQLPRGRHEGSAVFTDAQGREIEGSHRTVTVEVHPGGPDALIFLSNPY